MLHNGRFPLTVHAIAEYVAGAALILAPFILSFDDDTATIVSVALGVVVIGIAASTEWGMSVMPSIPLPFHLALDLVLAALLVASPFLFGFSDETAPTAFFIALGVIHLLLTLGTRFEGGEDDRASGSSPAAGDRADSSSSTTSTTSSTS